MVNDLRIEDGVEVNNIRHSPIVGWSYDGVPIYGPYGFSNSKKGLVKQMVSSYELNIDNPNRPSKSIYPGGFFVEDYVFTNKVILTNTMVDSVSHQTSRMVSIFHNCHKCSRFFWSFQEL